MATKKIKLRKTGSLYYWLLGLTFLLLLFGTVMIFSASQIVAYSQTNDSYYYLKKHLIALFMGLIGLYLFSRANYKALNKYSLYLAIVSLILLVGVLIPGIGTKAGGSSSWFDLGILNFQPSEFAKLTLIIFVASLLSRKDKDLSQLKELLLPLAPLLGLFLLLMILQPDLGTAIALAFTVLAMVFIAGAKNAHILGLLLTGVFGTVLLVLQKPYRVRRILAFVNPWDDPYGKGFHIIQSLLALGSGGLEGVGLGMSRQKFFYLPAGHTDFILSIVGEELGLGGTLFVVFMFLFLAYIGIRICNQAKDKFGQVLGGGIITLILFQAIINMGVAVGILPITGITLPLISFGGSSLVFTLTSIGILLSIASHGKEFNKKADNARDNLRRRDGRTHLPRRGSGRRVAFQGKS